MALDTTKEADFVKRLQEAQDRLNELLQQATARDMTTKVIVLEHVVIGRSPTQKINIRLFKEIK